MSDPANPWTIKSTRIAYENPWMRVREDSVITPSGKDGIYGYIEANNSVMVIAFNEKREVYVVRTFRYPVKTWNWEVPGGGGDNQHPIEAGKRELEEETGITAKTWDELGATSVCNGFTNETMTTLLARDLDFGGNKEDDVDEQVTDGKFCSLAEIDAMITSGDINDGQTMTALYLLNRWLARQER